MAVDHREDLPVRFPVPRYTSEVGPSVHIIVLRGINREAMGDLRTIFKENLIWILVHLHDLLVH